MLDLADLTVELGEPDAQEVTGQGVVVVRRVDFLDLVAELGEQRGGTLDGGDASGSGLGLMAEEIVKPIRRRAGRPVDASVKGTDRGSRRRTPRSGVGAPTIASSSAALSRTVRETTPWVTIPNMDSLPCGPYGREATAELQPDQAVAGGGDADRPAAVVRAGRRDDARGDRGA